MPSSSRYRKLTLASHMLVSVSMLLTAMTGFWRVQNFHSLTTGLFYLEQPERYALPLAANEIDVKVGYAYDDQPQLFVYCDLFALSENWRTTGYPESPRYWDKSWCEAMIMEPIHGFSPFIFESPDVAAMDDSLTKTPT